MSEPIKVGDLVVVVYSCCNHKLGSVGQVESFYQGGFGEKLLCDKCCRNVTPRDSMTAQVGEHYWPLSWLKRIPPLSELEGEQREEELTA